MSREEIKRSEESVGWAEGRRSQDGRYEKYVKAMSAALPAVPRKEFSPVAGARPFEVELFRIPAGKRFGPVHIHSAQWEYYIVLQGEGRIRLGDGEEPVDVRAGDHVIQPPGWAHAVENTGKDDLLYYIISDNPPVETVYQPHSDKWIITAPKRKVFRMQETEFFDGE